MYVLRIGEGREYLVGDELGAVPEGECVGPEHDAPDEAEGEPGEATELEGSPHSLVEVCGVPFGLVVLAVEQLDGLDLAQRLRDSDE